MNTLLNKSAGSVGVTGGSRVALGVHSLTPALPADFIIAGSLPVGGQITALLSSLEVPIIGQENRPSLDTIADLFLTLGRLLKGAGNGCSDLEGTREPARPDR